MFINQKVLKAVLMIARIIGTSIFAFILFFLLAHLFGEDESGEGFRNAGEVIMFIFFPVSTFVGLGLALKWEGIGGLITTIGMIGLFIMRPELLFNLYMTVPIVPGMLYLFYWWARRDLPNSSPEKSKYTIV